ncbi:MAG: PAS domain S-box protein, partial [Desulfomonilaceae bacterium]
MQDIDKTKEQLLGELGELHSRIAVLESALKMSNSPESKYREMIDQVTEAVFVVQEGWIKFVNPAYSELTGYSMEEALASGIIESLVHPDDREMAARYHTRRLQGETTHFRLDFRIICKDGTVKWVALKSSLIMWEGKPAALCLAVDITERKKMQASVKESEKTLKSILSASPVGIIHTQNAMIKWANQAWREIFGFSDNQEYLNQPTQIMHPSYVEYQHVRSVLYTNIKRAGISETDAKLRRNDGTVFDAHIRINLLDQDDPSKGTISAITDISERKQMEESLREAESRQKRAELVTRFGNWVFDFRTGKVRRSAGANKIYGLSKHEITIEEAKSIPLPEYRPMLDEAFRALIKENKPYDVEFKIRRQTDGAILDIHSIAEFDPKTNTMFGVIQDITERKRAEEALLQSEKRYRELTEFLPQPVYEVDTTMKPTFVNPACVELSGYTSEELLSGFNPLTLVIPEDRAKMAEDFQKLMQGQTIVWSEYTGLRKDGTTIPVLSNAAPIYENEMVVGIRGVISDITPLKRAEQEKMALQNQLFQSQKMETVGTLVGGIAHDFNNMLQIILGYSQLLLYDKKEGDPGYTDLQTIIRTVKEGAELVEKLRAFGQQSQLLTVPLDLNLQITEAYKLMARTLPQVVQIDMDLTDEQTTICADPNQIDQILINLAANASEAMPNGGRLTIATKTLSPNDGPCLICNKPISENSVMLSVKDTGRGMNKETLSKIYDPFFSTKQRGAKKGTGLGLSVVQGLVQQQGGHICCQSEPG